MGGVENPGGGQDSPGSIRVAVMLCFFGYSWTATSYLVMRLRGERLGGAIVQKPCGLLDEGFDSLPYPPRNPYPSKGFREAEHPATRGALPLVPASCVKEAGSSNPTCLQPGNVHDAAVPWHGS